MKSVLTKNFLLVVNLREGQCCMVNLLCINGLIAVGCGEVIGLACKVAVEYL